jgi:two-component system NarL family response regulator
MINTVIIHDHNLFREGFKLLLDKFENQKFNFYNANINDLIDNDKSFAVDLIFLELNDRWLDKISIIKKLKRNNKKAKVAVLSDFENTKVVRESFQNGADGYFLNKTNLENLEKGINEILNERMYMTEGLRLTPKKGHQPQPELRQNLYNGNFPIKQKLTKRENEVLTLIVLAKSNKEIGRDLFISEQTVGVHKKNIMRKLGVHNTVSLIRFSIDNNLA